MARGQGVGVNHVTRPASRATRPATLAALILAVVMALVVTSAPGATAAAPLAARKVKGEAVWDVTTVAAGGSVVVHGTVKVKSHKHKAKHKTKHHGKHHGKGHRLAAASKPHRGKHHHKVAKVKVLLQISTAGGWNTLAKTKSDKKGDFAFTQPLNWLGTHTMRVVTKGKKGFESDSAVSVPLTYTPRGNPATWHPIDPARNWRFNPCAPVTYRINPGTIGLPGIALVQLGMAQISTATGIPVQYLGPSTQIPFADPDNPIRLEAGTNLVIAFASNTQVPEFASMNKAGFGGPLYGYSATNGAGTPATMMTESGVTYSSDDWGHFAPSFDATTGASVGELVIHELGHAFGLGHTPEDADQIMNGFTYKPYDDGHWRGLYANGDLTGLQAVGYGSGCLTMDKGAKLAGVTGSPMS